MLLLFILLLCCFGDGGMVQVATATAPGCLCILWELRVLTRHSCASPPGNWVPLCWTAAFRASSWGHPLLNLYLQSMHSFKDIYFLGNDPQTQAGFAAHTVWTAGIPGTAPGRAAQLPRHLWENSLKFGRDRLCAVKSPLVLAIPGKSQPERKALSVRNQGSWALRGKGARNSSCFANKIITRNEKFSFLTAACWFCSRQNPTPSLDHLAN